MKWKDIEGSYEGVFSHGDNRTWRTRWWLRWLFPYMDRTVVVLTVSLEDAINGFKIGVQTCGIQKVLDTRLTSKTLRMQLGYQDTTYFAISVETGDEITLTMITRGPKTLCGHETTPLYETPQG